MCLAVPGRIESIADAGPLMRVAKVDFGGVSREVNLACVPEAAVGDYVLVHVGFALSVIDAGEADRVFGYLREIEAL
jgi:hydrogenase expression/formation protein HypC